MGKVYEGYYVEDTCQHRDIKYQSLGLPEDAKYINKRRVPLKDGYEKASGRAVYSRDVSVPGMLYAKMMASPHGHAKILSMDTSKAEALPGVRGIVRYDDPYLAGHPNSIQAGKNHDIIDGIAWFYNCPVACAIAADNPDICDEALKLVEIEWEQLPMILDWEESMEPGATILDPDISPDTNVLSDNTTEIGDVEHGFSEADQIIELETRNDENDGASAEGGIAVASWKGEYLDIWVKHQMPFIIQLTGFNDYPWSKMSMYNNYQGATFGGISWKTYSRNYPRVASALAQKTGRPVKLIWDEQHFYGADWQYGTCKYKIGFKNDGTVTALEYDNIQSRRGTAIPFDDLEKQCKVHNLKGRGRDINVSRGPTVCYRDCTVVTEKNCLIWSVVSEALNMDPEQVCLKNVGGYGKSWDDLRDWRIEMEFDPDRDSLKECWAAAKQAIDWDNKWHAAGEKLLPNGKYHGIGFQWSHEWTNMKRPCLMGLMINSDGSVAVLGRHGDIGVHHETAICQIVADELGAKFEDVNFRSCFTNLVGYELQDPGGSTNMVANSPSAVRVARKAKRMLLELACKTLPSGPVKVEVPYPEPAPAPFPGKTADELDVKDSVVFEKANPDNKKTIFEVVRHHWSTDTRNMRSEPVVVDDYTGPIDWRPAHCQQLHITEVEVDPETGKVDVTRIVCVNDVGIAINPDTINGQQYGGAFMGVGRSNTEEIYYDPITGVKMNDDLYQYPIALMNDVHDSPICHIVETRQSYGAYGLAGIGENIGAIMSSCTKHAVYNAIGKWVDVPTTPDKILKALGKV